MITVVGGNKGGSGKTTTASNLAIALAHEGHDVCLLNGDLQRTALNIMLNVKHRE
jgi:chromosome partitioning protein